VPQGSAGSGLSRRLLGVAVLALTGFVVLALLAAAHQLSTLDHQARALVHLTRLPLLDPAMNGVSGVGEHYGLIPLMTLGVAVLWRPRRRWAMVLPLLMAGTGALQLVAKWAIDRPRPNLAAWGFPSGHVLSLVVFFGLMTYLLASSTLARPRRWLGYAGWRSASWRPSRAAGQRRALRAQKRRFTLPTMKGVEPTSIRLSWRSEYPSPSK